MTALRDQVAELLAQHPEGLSTNDVAAIMNRKPRSTSSLLSKGVYYNYWNRKDYVEHGRRWTLWLPATVVPTFVPPRRHTKDVP